MTPSRFREELKHFDKQLDFVYNGRKARWEIIGEDLKHHKYLIKSFSLGQIETVGLDTIRTMAEVSPIKQSARDINKRIDAIIEEEEKQEEKNLKNSIHDRLDEAWSRLQYAEGSRISFALAGQKDDEKNSFIVTDKRRFKDSSNTSEEICL